jgi:hypothetical protein
MSLSFSIKTLYYGVSYLVSSGVVILYTCGLFNDTVSGSDCIASNVVRLINTKLEMTEGSSRGLMKGTIPAFTWRV